MISAKLRTIKAPRTVLHRAVVNSQYHDMSSSCVLLGRARCVTVRVSLLAEVIKKQKDVDSKAFEASSNTDAKTEDATLVVRPGGTASKRLP